MKREWANAIRFAMDEFVPPAIRDSRWFMKPFYVAAYGTSDVDRFMDFKDDVWSMSEQEYSAFYQTLGASVSRRRVTDLNRASVQWILDSIPDEAASVLDVGCGNGYLLDVIQKARPAATVRGTDVVAGESSGIRVDQGLLPRLPYADQSFDYVTCSHVLEHVTNLAASCAELVRVARREVLVVVPRQRAFHYTLDEHVNFFWDARALGRHFRPLRVRAALLDGDWAIRVVVQ